jgi:hypothetical protein
MRVFVTGASGWIGLQHRAAHLAMPVPTSTQLKYISVGSFARTTGIPSSEGSQLGGPVVAGGTALPLRKKHSHMYTSSAAFRIALAARRTAR